MKRKLDCRFRRRAHAAACGTLFVALGSQSFAQQEAATRGTLKVEVTGSNIWRSEAESALPVQVITRQDILYSGAMTTPELLSKVSANILGFNDQMSLGNTTQPGLASANLRGIGDGSTLVLLNGRRIANYAFNGGTVDLNSIPLAALERVEILKDGGSAIYGTDAIAGVINFILRKDFQGLEATGYGAWTQHGGGDQWQAVVSAGYGDLAKDRFNVFATLNYQKDSALQAVQRPFSATSYLPAEGINGLSSNTFPANFQAGRRLWLNPTLASGCTPPISLPAMFPLTSTVPICGFDYTSVIDIIPPAERTGVIARASFQVNPQNELFAEANYAYNRFTFRVSPTPVSQTTTSTLEPVLYPANGPFYPTEFAAANGVSGDLNLRYRTVALGPRNNETDTKALRALVGAAGIAWDWDYSTAFWYSQNKQTDGFESGYVSQRRMLEAMATGLINPFGPSGPEGDALLASTQVTGETHAAKGTTIAVDFKASKDVYTLPGGAAAVAIGAEFRREKLENTFEPVWTSGDILGSGGDQQSVSENSRRVAALFIEGNIPFAKGWEAQIAARYDHYNDFGSTVNPKIALRWQPVKSVLVRGSWGTGFRAPTLYDLYTPLSHTFTFGAADPVRCPVTALPEDCGDGNFPVVTGGNPNLQPEKSQQYNAGAVWQPVPAVSFTVDYWRISKTGVIGALSDAAIFGNFSAFESSNIVRGPSDAAYPGLPGPIQTVIEWNQNLGKLTTSGIDVDATWRSPASALGLFTVNLNGTYVITWKQQVDGVNYVSNVGRNPFEITNPVPRWKHYLVFGWQYGAWGATLAQTFQSGYVDANVDRFGTPLPVPPRNVGNYDVWDIQGRYTGFANATIALGIKDLMDRAPPFTNQPFWFQVGYDPTYADPRGRIFYARLTYGF